MIDMMYFANAREDGDDVGQVRRYDMIDHRERIMNEICRSEVLIALLGCADEEHPEDIIPYKYSYPYEYIPEAIDNTDRFINFEISTTVNPKNNVFDDLVISFFVMCHEDVIQCSDNGRNYLWYDKAASELDRIICGGKIAGIGKTFLTSNAPYAPQSKLKGRLLKFEVKDLNYGARYGK